MQFSPAQVTALKAYIATQPTLLAQLNTGQDQAVADALNANASPDFWVWRTSVSQLEIVTTTTADGTVWSWPAFIARTQGERDGWREMFADGGSVNASLANVRQGFADIFSNGPAGAAAQRTHLLTVGRRKATLAEKVCASGTGSTASPGTLDLEGAVAAGDVGQLR
jgi:hypothetical protein